MEFKSTDYYKRVLGSVEPEKVYPAPYYAKTDMDVTEDNFSSIVDLEEIKYQVQLDSIDEIPNFYLRAKIEDRIRPFIGSKLLILKFGYFNALNIDEGYKFLESEDDFSHWLIK